MGEKGEINRYLICLYVLGFEDNPVCAYPYDSQCLEFFHFSRSSLLILNDPFYSIESKML